MANLDKFIEKVIADWSARSPDGLVGGYDTFENREALKQTLSSGDYKLSPKEIQSLMPKILKRAELETADGGILTVESMTIGKKLPLVVAKKIYVALKKLRDKERKEFIGVHYNSKTIQEAVDFLNAGYSSGVYSDFFTALDAARVSKTGESTSKVGRGEYALVLMVAGCKTGGGGSGDLLLKDGTSADVKEMTGEGFRVSQAAFGNGAFEKIPFVHAVNQLITFCSGHPERSEVLKKLCDSANLVDEGYREANSMTKRFFESPSWGNINVSVVEGLTDLMAHIQELDDDELTDAGIGDKVEFDVDNLSKVFSVTDMASSEKKKIVDPNLKPETPITVQVSPVTDEESQLIMPAIKRLKLFSLPERGGAFTPKNVANSMLKALQNKPGHYTAGIVLLKKGKTSSTFEYEPDLTKLQHGELNFYGYAQTGPVFARKKV